MSDRDALASAFAARYTTSGTTHGLATDHTENALAAICDNLNAASGAAVREAWWRRGGELFQSLLLAARRATHPLPIEATQARQSLTATGRAGVSTWTFAPVDVVGALEMVDHAESQIPTDHPMAEAVAMHLAEVRRGWQHLGALHDQSIADDELAHVWSARWPTPDGTELAAAIEVLDRHTMVHSDRPAPPRTEILERFAAALASVAPEWKSKNVRMAPPSPRLHMNAGCFTSTRHAWTASSRSSVSSSTRSSAT